MDIEDTLMLQPQFLCPVTGYFFILSRLQLPYDSYFTLPAQSHCTSATPSIFNLLLTVARELDFRGFSKNKSIIQTQPRTGMQINLSLDGVTLLVSTTL